MHKRPMRRIHQPYNAVIHVARQVSPKMRAAKPRRKLRHLRHRTEAHRHPTRTRLQAHKPMRSRRAPRKETRRQKFSSASSVSSWSVKESQHTAHCKARTPSRGTCTAPSRRRTTPPTAESHDADKGRASQTTCLRSSAPAPADARAAGRRRLAHAQHIRAQRRIPIAKDQLRRRPSNILNWNQIIHHALEL